MYYKVTMQFNWLTNLGFIIISKEDYDDCVKKLEKVSEREITFAYTADGDDLIAQYDKNVGKLLEEFGKAEKISNKDYKVLEKCGCTSGSPIASDLYSQIWDFLDNEVEDDDEDDDDEE